MCDYLTLQAAQDGLNSFSLLSNWVIISGSLLELTSMQSSVCAYLTTELRLTDIFSRFTILTCCPTRYWQPMFDYCAREGGRHSWFNRTATNLACISLYYLDITFVWIQIAYKLYIEGQSVVQSNPTYPETSISARIFSGVDFSTVFHVELWYAIAVSITAPGITSHRWITLTNRSVIGDFCVLFDVSPNNLLSKYRKVSNIRRTKSQNWNDSHLVLKSSLPNPLKLGVKSRIKM